MVKIGLLNKSKEKTVICSENKPKTEYHETLYTEDKKSKKAASAASSDQRVWRDVKLIEEKVDKIHPGESRKHAIELDRVVDRLIAKKKK